MQFPEVREMVFNSLQTNAVGDQFVLVAKLGAQPISVGSRPEVQTFGDLFSSRNVLSKSKQSSSKDLAAKYPLLEVRLIDQYDKEEVRKASLPVAYFVEEDVDPLELSAYSDKDLWHKVDAIVAPEEPYLFVGLNEELYYFTDKEYVEVFGKKALCPVAETYYRAEQGAYVIDNDYYAFINCSNPGGPVTGPTPPPSDATNFPCPNSDREDNDGVDIFHRFRFHNKRALDDAFKNDNLWGDYTIQLRVTVLFAQGSQTGSVGQTTMVHHIKKGWLRKNPLFGSYQLLNYTANTSIVTWQPGFHGINMRYFFSEKDGGDRGSFKITYATTLKDPDSEDETKVTLEANIPLDEKDTDLGDKIVQYCDVTSGDGKEYENGSVVFSVRQ